ncbi:toxoplasma gondii family a protein [Cystoisospora suis]|uniref:Toxoplasma gondii family a protein n=1 Tax=Cystoisospora suis TaxID=483139 RepID=A0A2C6L9S5_9APIC|nr:toxoplasma gondii family a protein [Cystoisospora suis]
MLRAVACLLILAGCVSYGRTEQVDSQPDYTETIPEQGMASTTRKIFWLKPGQVLKVSDSTGTAVFEPVPPVAASSSAASDPFDPTAKDSLNAIAYAFKDGACDFNTTIKYKEAFKKLGSYTTPLWNPAKRSEQKAGWQAAAVKDYIFTNPPAEYLEGVVSFCVRFKTTKNEKQSLRSGQTTTAGEQATYLEVVIQSGGVGVTAKLLGILGLAAAAVGKAISV